MTEQTDGVRLDRGWAWPMFVGFFAFVSAMVIMADLDFEARPSLPWMLAAISLGAGLVLAVSWALPARWRQHPRLRRMLLIGLAMAVLVAGFNYFYLGRGLTRSTYPHLWDMYHYLLGAKYYDELDYPHLYDCTLAALPKSYRGGRIRDLRTNAAISSREALSRTPCFAMFSEARWNEFKHDLGVLAEARSWRFVRRMLRDKGYNGTPPHTAIAGAIANAVSLDVAMLSKLTLIDVGALCLMMAVMVGAFGWKIGLLFALYFFCNASDRHLIVGNSFFRYIWMVSLALGIACLARQRYAWAGASIATSTMLNVFPIVFAVGVGLKMAVSWLREGSLAPRYRRFLLGAAVASAILVAAGASTARGVGNYLGFIENMQVHDVSGQLPGFGVGLKFNFVTEVDKDPEVPRTSPRYRIEQFEEVRPWYLLAALVLVGAALWVAVRLDDLEAAVLVGFTLFFALLGTTAYYYACASFLVVLWYRRHRQTAGALMLGLLFLLNGLALLGWWAEYHRFFVFNRLVTGTWTLYLTITLAYLLVEQVKAARDEGPASSWTHRLVRRPPAEPRAPREPG